MKTYPVEQINVLLSTLAIELGIAVLFSILGFFLIRKFAKSRTESLTARFYGAIFGGVAVVAGIIVLAGFTTSAALNEANTENLKVAVTEAGYDILPEQLTELEREGFTNVNEDVTLSFSDEATGHLLTAFSSSENDKEQKEQAKEAAEKLKTNDY